VNDARQDAQQDARHALHEASADLEALRTQAGATIGDTKPEDEPIKNAWAVALDRYRAACTKYVEVMT
jgi:hypothetical protein